MARAHANLVLERVQVEAQAGAGLDVQPKVARAAAEGADGSTEPRLQLTVDMATQRAYFGAPPRSSIPFQFPSLREEELLVGILVARGKVEAVGLAVVVKATVGIAAIVGAAVASLDARCKGARGAL